MAEMNPEERNVNIPKDASLTVLLSQDNVLGTSMHKVTTVDSPGWVISV